MTDADQALLDLDDETLIKADPLISPEFDELENQLALRAACLGWTGDPMCQPLDSVAACVRTIIRNRNP